VKPIGDSLRANRVNYGCLPFAPSQLLRMFMGRTKIRPLVHLLSARLWLPLTCYWTPFYMPPNPLFVGSEVGDSSTLKANTIRAERKARADFGGTRTARREHCAAKGRTAVMTLWPGGIAPNGAFFFFFFFF